MKHLTNRNVTILTFLNGMTQNKLDKLLHCSISFPTNVRPPSVFDLKMELSIILLENKDDSTEKSKITWDEDL